MEQSLTRRPKMGQRLGVPTCPSQQRRQTALAVTIRRIGSHGLVQGRMGTMV